MALPPRHPRHSATAEVSAGASERSRGAVIEELLRRSEELRERSTCLNDQISQMSARVHRLCALGVRGLELDTAHTIAVTRVSIRDGASAVPRHK